jgi:hypothetical protein
MDLPVFRRGLELVSAQLNKLSDNIRASTVTSVIGGKFTRTPGGTTLIINPVTTQGAGSGSATKDCNFNVTDASIWNEAGNQVTTMQVKVANSKLAGVYPTGMDAETPYYIVLDPETGFSAAGICYLYLRAIINDDGVISAEENSLTFEPAKKYLPSGQHIQLIPVAQIEIAPIIKGSGKEIVKIGNSCPSGVFPLENCPFAAEEATEGTTLKVLISNSMIEGVYPNNMERNVPFIHDLTAAPIQYVHADIKLDASGAVDYADPSAIMIYITNTILESNAYYQRSVLGMIQVAGGKITAINNYCYSPTVPYLRNCPFEVVDATVDGGPGIVVRNWQVQGRYPSGMDYNTFFYLPIADPHTYVYCGLVHNAAGEIEPGSGSIFIETSTSLKTNTDAISYTLLSEVFYTEGKPIDIWNYCTMPTVDLNRISNCNFRILNVSDSSGQKIEIKSGTAGNRLPDGMSPSYPSMILWVSNSSYVYVAQVFDPITNQVIPGPSGVTIELSETPETNTDTITYTLIGVVTMADEIIVGVWSWCEHFGPNPCDLDWSVTSTQ